MKTAEQWLAEFKARNTGLASDPVVTVEDIKHIQADAMREVVSVLRPAKMDPEAAKCICNGLARDPKCPYHFPQPTPTPAV